MLASVHISAHASPVVADAEYEAARRVAPYGDDEAERQGTEAAVAAGHRVLQIFKLAPDDRRHISELLSFANLPLGAAVLDAGCGVGAVAVLMADLRPDLRITLLNISRVQLGMCPAGFQKMAASFHEIPAPPASFDAVLFLYSLGHGQLEATLTEAARVLKPGGVVFIYDLAAADTADRSRLIATLGYVAHGVPRVLAAASAAGLRADLALHPQNATRDAFDTVMERPAADALLSRILPVLYRMVKQ